MKPISFFPRFNELTFNDTHVDFHLHSTWTDGKESVSEIIDTSKKHNLHAIAITDHIRKESTYFDDYEIEIDAFNDKNTMNIYKGFEAKVSNFAGDIDVEERVARKADIAIVSVHRFPLGNKLYNASEFSKNVAQEIELELSLAALKSGGFNVLGHPGGMSLTYFHEFPIEFFEKIIISCVENNIAFDFNGRYHIKQKEILYPLLKKYNPHVSIGTDSHSVSKMGKWNKILEEYVKCQ